MRLVITGEDGARSDFPLASDEVVVGRAAEAGVQLEDRDVSRRHARLVRDETGWSVEDLGSSSGTRLDGTLIGGRRPLTLGTTVQIGGYTLRLEPEEAELETLPPHPSPAQADAMERPETRRPSLVVAGLALLLLCALGAGGWAWQQRSVRLARCRAVALSFDQRDWSVAKHGIDTLQSAGQSCPDLDLPAILADVETNLAALKALDEGRRLLAARSFDGALEAVAAAPKGSLYAEELERVTSDARRGQMDAITEALEAALGAQRPEEARSLIDQLGRFGFDPQRLDAWRIRLERLEGTPAPAAAAVSEPPPAASAARAPIAPAMPNRRPVGERDAEARRLYDAAGNDIRASDMLGAVDKLQRALDVDPSKNLRCQLLKSLGVAYSRSGKKVETARTYKAYLACDPAARDREQLERVIREAAP